MKEILLRYADYNLWANKRIVEAMLNLDEIDADREVVSSFPSLRATVYHTWSAEYVWLQRLEFVEQPVWIQGSYTGTFAAACVEWERVSELLIQFVARQPDDLAFEQICQFHDRQGVAHKSEMGQILHHVFNHSTYHRGQMVTILRQLGLKEIPGTDLIAYFRHK
jgi:uncharacterized damage-inducible protein DinB